MQQLTYHFLFLLWNYQVFLLVLPMHFDVALPQVTIIEVNQNESLSLILCLRSLHDTSTYHTGCLLPLVFQAFRGLSAGACSLPQQSGQ